MSVFGAIVSASVPAQALRQRLLIWLPTYLAEIDRQYGTTSPGTSAPKSIQIVSAFDLSDEPQMPAIYIVSPGPLELPLKDGSGNVRGVYEFNVHAVVTAPTAELTTDLRDRYAAAILNCVMQKRSLGDPSVRGIDHRGTNPTPIAADERRTKQAASVDFAIEYEHVANWKVGPSLPIEPANPINNGPPTDPTVPIPDLGQIPDADHVGVTLTKKP